MKHISELTSTKPIISESRASFTPVAEKAVNRFFAVMSGIYGRAWTSQFADDLSLQLAKEQWAKHLGEFDMGQIKSALDRVVDHHPKWPPTIGEFKILCRPDPAEHGLPSVIDAWSEICRADAATGGKYSHGIVLAARNDPRCDAYNWRMLPLDQGQRRFEPIYLEYVSRAMAGEQFEVPDMIEHKPAKPMNREDRVATASRYLGDLKSALRGQS